MKKVVSLFLALVMVFALATTAMAAETTKIVVGEDPREGYEDGWTQTKFDEEIDNDGTGVSSDVAIKVSTGAVEHRYAVDVTYSDTNLAIYGEELVWDVNELKYVAADGNPAEGLTGNAPKAITITVDNRSDMPITVNVGTVDSFPENDNSQKDGISIAVVGNSEFNVDAATTGSAKTATATVNVSPTDSWDAVRSYYSTKLSGANSSINVGSISVTISRPTP